MGLKSKWVLGALACAACGAAMARPMNVVFILADDLGWADTTLHGKTSLYKTPNLERLARRGMTFTRASLLTGHPQRDCAIAELA